MVYQSILRKPLFKWIIPSSVFSISTLTAFSNQAKAETTKGIISGLKERGDVINNPYAYSGSANGESFFGHLESIFREWIELGVLIGKGMTWINNLEANIAQITIDVLAFAYRMMTYALFTPTILFTSVWSLDTTKMFIVISLLIISLLAVIEGIKQVVLQNNTKLTDMLKRYCFALFGMGVTPILFEKSFYFINKLSAAISQVSYEQVKSGDVMAFAKTSGLETFGLVVFNIILVVVLVPVLLQSARRWFDLLCLSILAPLAYASNIFDSTRHYFTTWWNSVKRLSMIQLTYAFYFGVLGTFMFGTKEFTEGYWLFIKLWIIIGGCYRLANPPAIVGQATDRGGEKNILEVVKNVVEYATLKKVRQKITPLSIKKKG